MLDYGFELEPQMKPIPLHSRILFASAIANDAPNFVFNSMQLSLTASKSLPTADKRVHFPIKRANVRQWRNFKNNPKGVFPHSCSFYLWFEQTKNNLQCCLR